MLGCIADDFTGATDAANAFARGGLRTLLAVGSSGQRVLNESCDALVVALKTRSISAELAVAQSLQALDWLQNVGCRRFFFKYGSTFDSTRSGNIGPVTEALLQRLGESSAVACPAFPATGRRVFFGHLFVNGALLNESGMERHPLNPMTDANLVRWLGAQSRAPIGLVDMLTVQQGENAVVRRLAVLQACGYRQVVVDAFDDSHLDAVAAATAGRRLNTGAAGFALALARHISGTAGQRPADTDQLASVFRRGGRRVVLAGSCSAATRRQIEFFSSCYPACHLSVPALLSDEQGEIRRLLSWVRESADRPCLIHSAAPEAPERHDEGSLEVGRSIERAFGQMAASLVAGGVDKLIVAGGETAGSAVRALRFGLLQVAVQIDPGVPWMVHAGPPPVALALKSGNFGADDFFVRAFDVLDGVAGAG